jgi:hypothetical protein
MKLGSHGRCYEVRDEARELKRARNRVCTDGMAKTIRKMPLTSDFGLVVAWGGEQDIESTHKLLRNWTRHSTPTRIARSPDEFHLKNALPILEQKLYYVISEQQVNFASKYFLFAYSNPTPKSTNKHYHFY